MSHDFLNRRHFWQDEDDGSGPAFGQGDHRAVALDQFDAATYLHADNNADGSASEQFILQVNGAHLAGSPVDLPGLGSNFGLYFLIDAQLAPANGGAPTFAKLNIALMVDPGNNDGAVSATSAGVGFANGASDDFVLATGTLTSASLAINGDPEPNTRHADFVEQSRLTDAGKEAFSGSVLSGDQFRELLTTLSSDPPFSVIPLPGGDSTALVNGGTSVVQLGSGGIFALATQGFGRSGDLCGHGD